MQHISPKNIKPKLTALHINIHSLPDKFDQLNLLLYKLKQENIYYIHFYSYVKHFQMTTTLPSFQYRCNMLRCPLARMSGLQCFNMGHNGHRINLYGVSMTLMGN